MTRRASPPSAVARRRASPVASATRETACRRVCASRGDNNAHPPEELDYIRVYTTIIHGLAQAKTTLCQQIPTRVTQGTGLPNQHVKPPAWMLEAQTERRSGDHSATLAKHQNAIRHPSHRGPPLGQSWKPAGGALERWWPCERGLLNTLLCQSYPNASFLLTKESLQCFICLTISSVACVRKNGRLVNEAPSAATSHEPWWTTRLRPAGHCAAAMPQPRPAGDSW